MLQNTTIHHVKLVTNRVFHGGQIYPLWCIFKDGKLTGTFSFVGSDWSAVLEVVNGTVTALQLTTTTKTLDGMDAFNGLQSHVADDSRLKFSITVPE